MRRSNFSQISDREWINYRNGNYWLSWVVVEKNNEDKRYFLITLNNHYFSYNSCRAERVIKSFRAKYLRNIYCGKLSYIFTVRKDTVGLYQRETYHYYFVVFSRHSYCTIKCSPRVDGTRGHSPRNDKSTPGFQN